MKSSLLLASVILLFSLLGHGAFAASHWDITVTGTNADTIWVRAVPYYESNYPPCGGMWAGGICMSEYSVVLNVTPCPLYASCSSYYYTSTCSGSVQHMDMYGDVFPEVTLALQAGTQYTLSGSATSEQQEMYMFWDEYMQEWFYWCMSLCFETMTLEPVGFGSPIGTKAQTWGQIKALFR
ncbi:MAG: hypothetical protein V2A71_00375 [Candidatus Eisenbacteria bacterium]